MTLSVPLYVDTGVALQADPGLADPCADWALEVRSCRLGQRMKERIRNTIIRQRTRVTDIVQYVTNTKWKWAGHIARMKDNRWTTRSTEWQIKGVRSAGRPTRRWRYDTVGQRGAVWTRIAKDRKMEDSGRGLLPAVEGHSLEQNRIEAAISLSHSLPSPGKPVLVLTTQSLIRREVAIRVRVLKSTMNSISQGGGLGWWGWG